MYSRQPLHPYDPVIQQAGSATFNYLRENFYGAGQDSFTKFPSQNQELWQSLVNFNPVAEGTFRLRHGYQLFLDTTQEDIFMPLLWAQQTAVAPVRRLYSYQNLQSSTRKLVYIMDTSVRYSSEDGTGLSTILSQTNGSTRAVNSRDYEYFPNVVPTITWPSGQQSDGKKWNSSTGLSDWGLAQPASTVNVTSVATAGNVTLVSAVGRVYAGAFLNSTTGQYSDINVGLGSFSAATSGPNFPTTAGTTNTGFDVWSNPTNIEASDLTYATLPVSDGSKGRSEILFGKTFGFAIPSTATILGIQAHVGRKANMITGTVADFAVQLIKTGVVTGDSRADVSTVWTTTLTDISYGGSGDLWGTTWTPADINNAGFGLAFVTQYGGIGTLSVDYFTITITYATGAGSNTGAIAGKRIDLSLPTANPPTGADKFVILSTLDGGDTSTFFVVDTVAVATTTYSDNTPDNVLATKNIATETDELGIVHGLSENSIPPLNMLFPTKHKGRLVGAIGSNLVFSKSLDEVTTSTGLILGRHEECFPVLNSIPVSTEEETIRGYMSDGNSFYIGTERHIWKLDGDGPLNYSKPEVIFNEVGVLNQDTWQVVFSEGQPVGMCWITPDNRVIMSNFASYQDIGTPIQDVLSSINSSAASAAWGQFYSRQEFDIYILALPTGAATLPNIYCIYDLRTQRWFTWSMTDQMTAGLMNISASGTTEWLFASSSGKVYQMLPSLTQDRVNDTPIGITATAKTVWLHLGQPTAIKAINEIEVITGDASLLVSIDGASKSSDVSAPLSVVSSGSLVASPRVFLKLYTAGNISKSRYYQFTFTSTGGIQDVLQGYNIEAVPFPY